MRSTGTHHDDREPVESEEDPGLDLLDYGKIGAASDNAHELLTMAARRLFADHCPDAAHDAVRRLRLGRRRQRRRTATQLPAP